MGDFGITKPPDPEEPELLALLKEEREHEFKMKLAGLKRARINTLKDIEERKKSIQSIDNEIEHINQELKTLLEGE